MSDDIKIWKCVECGDGCVLCELNCCCPPDDCVYKESDRPCEWKKTDEYEIIRRKPVQTDDEKEANEKIGFTDGIIGVVKIHAPYGQIPEDTAKNVSVAPTPNCAVCEWRESHTVVKIENFDALSRALTGSHTCSAQAYRFVAKCYNTPECKSLFSVPVKEDKP